MSQKVVIVEDDPLMRLAITTAVRSAGFQTVFETASGAEAIRFASRNKVDAAILDLHLGHGPNGLDVAGALRKLNQDLGLVILTSFQDPRILSGATGPMPPGTQYLVKSQMSEVKILVEALITSMDPKARAQSYRRSSALGNLTQNQIETLKLVAQGLSNAEIAKVRFVTERSVEVAIARIAKSLGLPKDAAKNQRVHIAQVYFRAAGSSGA